MGNSPSDVQEGCEVADQPPVHRDNLQAVSSAPSPASTRSATGLTVTRVDGEGGSTRTNRGENRSASISREAARANASGVELLRQNQHDEAIRQFQIALTHEPGSVQILNNIGLAHAKKQDFNGAYEWYEKAHKEDRGDVETLFSLAWVERKRHYYAHSKELFQQVLQIQPEHVKALYLLGDILKTAHDYDGATRYFERLSRLDPSSIDGHISLAQCYEHKKDLTRAAHFYTHVLQLAPKRHEVAFYLGRVHFLQNQYEQCLVYFDRVPDTDSRGFEARAFMAKACREIGDTDRAILNAERAEKLKHQPEVMHFLAEEYIRKDDLAKAEQWLTRGIEVDPSHMACLFELGKILQKQSRWSEAERYLVRLSELDRSSVGTLRALAKARFMQQKLAACQLSCEAALKLELMHAETLWFLAETHRLNNTGGVDDRWFLQLHYPPGFAVADVCQAIAKSYLGKNDTIEGLQWLQKAQHYLPSDKRISEAIGVLVRQSGNAQEVIDALEGRRMTSDSPQSRTGLTAAVSANSIDVSVDASDNPEGLERLLRRAERAAATVRDSGEAPRGAAYMAAERQWQEVLAKARSATRKRPQDAAALRCVARALLALGGDLSEIRDYARRATWASSEASAGAGFTLGHELHVYLGQAYESESDMAEAERHYTAALSSKPGDEQAMLGLARVLLKRRLTDRARQLYEQVASANPNCVESAVQLAELAVEAGGNPAEAYRLASHAVKLSPSDPSALLSLGKAAVAVGRPPAEAIKSYEQVIAIQPKNVAAMLTLAQLQQKAGKAQDAIDWFRRVLDFRPGDYECSLSLAKLHAERGAAGASQALHFFRSALQCRPSSRDKKSICIQMADVQRGINANREAFSTLESLTKEYPDDKEVWEKLLTLSGDMQDAKTQMQCHKRLQQLGADTPSTKASYGELLLTEGQVDKAKEQLEWALKEDPNNVSALFKLGMCFRQDNNLEEARKVFDQVLRISPQHAEALQEAAYCQRKANNLDQAIQLYKSSLDIRPTAEGPLYYLGDILYKQHRHAECQHYLQRLLQTNCSHTYKIGALYLLIKSHVSLDEYVEAERQARAGLQIKLNHPHFLFMLGLIKHRVGDYVLSIQSLEEALRHCDSPEEVGSGNNELKVDCYDWLAQAYERKHDYTKAMEQLDIALKLDPSHVPSLITKGLVHIQLKQLDQAESLLRRALAVEKNHALALVRLGYCKLLSSDGQEAMQFLNRALQQRCGTVPLPRSIKGTARVYLALALMSQQDINGALFQLEEAQKSHAQFGEICTNAKESIEKGEIEGVVAQLTSMRNLDVSTTQAWQLLHLMAKAVEKMGMAAEADMQAIVNNSASGRALPRSANADRPTPAPGGAAAAATVPERRRWEAPPPAERTPAVSSAASPAASSYPAQEQRRWAAPAPAVQENQAKQTRTPYTPAPAGSALGSTGSALGSTGSVLGSTHEQTLQQKLDLHDELIDFNELVQAECLGSGGFGAVYRGTYQAREVAIKKLFCEDGGNVSPLQLEELGKEVKALRMLRHPRLVAFIGACLRPPNLCIITEFMPGGSLHHLLHKAKTPLTLSQQAKIALQVCEGVSYLHGLSPPVVHRDLKSLNIVLDLEYNAKLCDFGLTTSMEKTHISLADGGNGGSPRYMAPECYDSKGKITEKVDVWALSCIIIECFGGPLPYDDCVNIQQIVAKLLIEKQAPYVPHHLPRGVRLVCDDCFHFDITRRTTAQDVEMRIRRLRLAGPSKSSD